MIFFPIEPLTMAAALGWLFKNLNKMRRWMRAAIAKATGEKHE